MPVRFLEGILPLFPELGIGILSWRAHDTLRCSLESYRRTPGFLDLFGERVIFFSDLSEADHKIAHEFGWRATGGENRGIAAGMRRLAEQFSTPYVILLQNDNPLVEELPFCEAHLRAALDLLDGSAVNLVRLRHRWHVGEGFSDVAKYIRYHPIVDASPHWIPSYHGVSRAQFPDDLKKRFFRAFRPIKTRRLIGRSVFIENAPDVLFPKDISRVSAGGDDFFVISSRVLEFSDQCVMMEKRFFLNVLMDYVDKHPSSRTLNGFQVPEMCLDGGWWRRQAFKVAQGTGIFSHARVDGSFRREHPGYEPE